MSQPPSYEETTNNGKYQRLYQEEDGETYSDDNLGFLNKPARLSFIRKVYGILSIQLLFTTLTCILFMSVDSVKTFIQGPNGYILLLTSILGTFIIMFALMCCNLSRKYPHNLLCLSLFTIFNSYMLGVVTSYSDTNAVILAAGATCVVTFSLTMYSILTRRDFTVMGGSLFTLLIILIFMGIASIFIHNQIYDLVYSGFGALLFSVYIIYDTQLIIGGKNRKYQISPDDYVLAALTLYLDIINLFLYILSLIDRR